MDGARNLLLATCKERNLRKIDKNVPDENYSFITEGFGTNSTYVHIKKWTSTSGDELVVPSGQIGPMISSNMLKFVAPRLGQTTENNITMMSGLDHSDPTGELYLRLIYYIYPGVFDGQDPIQPVLSLVDKDNSVRMVITIEKTNTDNTFTVRIKYTDLNLASHDVKVDLPLIDKDYHDMKIFIPAGKPLTGSIQMSKVTDPVKFSSESGVGYKDTLNQRLSIWSVDGTTPSGSWVRLNRIGIGNKITTPLP